MSEGTGHGVGDICPAERDCFVDDYSGKIDRELIVTTELSVSGQMNGSVIVHPGGRLRLSGQANGDVLVLEGGRLCQSGQLNGDLRCQGFAEIAGQINGLVIPDGGTVLVAEGVQRNTQNRCLVLDSSGSWVPSTGTSVVGSRFWQWHPDGSLTLT